MEKIKKNSKKNILIFLLFTVIIAISIFYYIRYSKNKQESEKNLPYNFENIKIEETTDFTDYLTNYSKIINETVLYENYEKVLKNSSKVTVKSGEYLKTYGTNGEFSKVQTDGSFYYIKNEDLENVSKGDYFKVVKGFLLVNTKYKLPSNFAPKFDKKVLEQVNLMFSDANREGVKLEIFKDYISYDDQKTLKKDSPNLDTKVKYAMYSDEGYNESQIGESVDLIGEDESKNLNESFKETKEFSWLIKNAYKYGFILRYPENKEDKTNYKFEPWHFRFVGVENAKIINEKNITLEEFLKMK